MICISESELSKAKENNLHPSMPVGVVPADFILGEGTNLYIVEDTIGFRENRGMGSALDDLGLKIVDIYMHPTTNQ